MDKKSDLRKRFNYGEDNAKDSGPEIKIYSRGAGNSRNDAQIK